ncbi:MAG: hypothetical protein CSA84_02080 [Actinomycetales bacterium]|nr:MAG: hypothetical protein CSA84_02080 [Actinomycetales bacterium]
MKQPVTKDPARRLAAAVCAVETIALVGLGVFYLLQLSNAADQARVATEAVLILLTAAGLGLLTRLWLADSEWSGTPTVVWHLLLIPVLVALAQSGQVLIAVALAAAVVLAVGAVIAQGRVTSAGDDGPTDAAPDGDGPATTEPDPAGSGQSR